MADVAVVPFPFIRPALVWRSAAGSRARRAGISIYERTALWSGVLAHVGILGPESRVGGQTLLSLPAALERGRGVGVAIITVKSVAELLRALMTDSVPAWDAQELRVALAGVGAAVPGLVIGARARLAKIIGARRTYLLDTPP